MKLRTAFLAISLSVGCSEIALAGSFDDFQLQTESSGRFGINTGTGYIGAYQMGNAALQTTGYKDSRGNWTGKNGATSQAAYLSCNACQTDSAISYDRHVWSALQSNGAANLVGTNKNGVVMNESSIEECGYVLGPGGCHEYLTSSPGSYSPGLQRALAKNPTIDSIMAKASQVDASGVTGHFTKVDNAAAAAAAKDGAISGGAAAAQIATFCAKEVQELMAQAGEQEVARRTALANSGKTGYTLMDGNGILEDAGVDGKGKGGILSKNALKQYGYEARTCLQNALDSISGVGSFFNKPDIASLVNQAINQACGMAMSQMQNFASPLYNKVSELNNYAYVGGGGYMPGMQLGSLSVGSGGGGTNGCSNGTCQFSLGSLINNDSSWYKGGDSGGNASGFGASPDDVEPANSVNIFGNESPDDVAPSSYDHIDGTDFDHCIDTAVCSTNDMHGLTG